MTLPGALGYLASGLVLVTFGMRTMVPMRVVATLSNLAFIAYGLSLHLTPVWVLHGILLPLNVYRLLEARRRARAVSGERPLERILPLITRRRFARGDVLFRKGERADQMFYVLNGRIRLRDIDGTLGDGEPQGGVGWSAPGGRRLATAVCETDCELLVVSERPRDGYPERMHPEPGERGLAGLTSWLHLADRGQKRSG